MFLILNFAAADDVRTQRAAFYLSLRRHKPLQALRAIIKMNQLERISGCGNGENGDKVSGGERDNSGESGGDGTSPAIVSKVFAQQLLRKVWKVSKCNSNENTPDDKATDDNTSDDNTSDDNTPDNQPQMTIQYDNPEITTPVDHHR
jgi:hypothetical protein